MLHINSCHHLNGCRNSFIIPTWYSDMTRDIPELWLGNIRINMSEFFSFIPHIFNRAFRLVVCSSFVFANNNCNWLNNNNTWFILANHSWCLQKQMKIELQVERLYICWCFCIFRTSSIYEGIFVYSAYLQYL